MSLNLKGKAPISDRFIQLLTIFLLSSFYIFASTSWGSYIMIGVTVAIFFLSAGQDNFRINWNLDRFQLGILIFFFFTLASSVWAWSSRASIDKAITIIEIFICITVLDIYYSKERSGGVATLLNIVMWSGFAIMAYTFYRYGFRNINYYVLNSTRFEDTYANINSIAMLLSVSIIVSLYKALYVKPKVYHLLSVFSIYLIAASGSRKALIMLAIGIVAILVVRFSSKNVIVSLFKYIAIGIALFYAFRFVLGTELFSGINHRMDGLIALITGSGTVDHSSWLRQQYIKIGIEQFGKTPIFGIGIGNTGLLLGSTIGSGTYLHNNYVELLASGGILGFIAYYQMYISLVVEYVKKWSQEDKELVILTILMMIILIMDYGNVSYYSKHTYFYLLMLYLKYKEFKVCGHSNAIDNSFYCKEYME